MSALELKIHEALSALADAMNVDDKVEVVHQLEILNSLGRPQSYSSVASSYDIGSATVEKRDDLAFYWYVKSAIEQDDCDSYFSIAYFYRNGIHVNQSHEQCMKYCEIAYEKGCIEAGIWLAICYIKGYSVSVDLERAEKYLKPALAAGYVASYALLGKIKFLRNHYFTGLKLYLHCYAQAIRLVWTDPQSRKLYALKSDEMLKKEVIIIQKTAEQWSSEN